MIGGREKPGCDIGRTFLDARWSGPEHGAFRRQCAGYEYAVWEVGKKMDGKCKWLEWICSKRGLGLILIVVSLLMIVAILAKPNWLINVLACILWIGGILIAGLTGFYCFLFELKPLPLKPSDSGDKISPEDSWKSFVISTRDSRFKQLINMDIYVITGVIGLIVFCTTLLPMPDAAKLKVVPIIILGALVFIFLPFTHVCATWAYVREVKKCPSVRFSREEGVWLLEVTDEIIHRLILADLLGFFILGALIVRNEEIGRASCRERV